MSETVKRINADELSEHGLDRIGELNPYITLLCDLRCRYCYMYDFLSKDAMDVMTDDFYYKLVTHFAEETTGLDRHTFLGGEPTKHPSITEFANYVGGLNVSEKRMTTNGISTHELKLNELDPDAFDHVSVSIDGHNSTVNDITRGTNTFKKIIATIAEYRDAGIKTSVNYTVTGKNIKEVLNAPSFFHGLGVNILNFHVVSNIGNALNNQELSLSVNPLEWIKQRNLLMETQNLPGLTLRIPYMYLTKEEVDTLGYKPIQERNYHSPNGGYRLIVFPPTEKGKGYCYMSADLVGIEGAHIASIDKEGTFHWNSDPRNEWLVYQNSKSTDVSSDLRGESVYTNHGVIPVSISYKKTIVFPQENINATKKY